VTTEVNTTVNSESWIYWLLREDQHQDIHQSLKNRWKKWKCLKCIWS